MAAAGVDALLADARSRLHRLDPVEAAAAMASGATNQRWRAIKTISWGLAAVVAVSLFNRNFPAVIQYLELIASDLRVYQRARPMPTGRGSYPSVDVAPRRGALNGERASAASTIAVVAPL